MAPKASKSGLLNKRYCLFCWRVKVDLRLMSHTICTSFICKARWKLSQLNSIVWLLGNTFSTIICPIRYYVIFNAFPPHKNEKNWKEWTDPTHFHINPTLMNHCCSHSSSISSFLIWETALQCFFASVIRLANLLVENELLSFLWRACLTAACWDSRRFLLLLWSVDTPKKDCSVRKKPEKEKNVSIKREKYD